MKNPLQKKFQLKDEYSVLLMNSKPDIHPLFEGIRVEFSNIENTQFDSVILFTKNEEELRHWVPEAESKRKKTGKMWLSYPKKSGKIKSNLNRDITWDVLKGFEMEPIRLISINEDWSSMRVVNKNDRTKPSKLGQDPPGVDRKAKTVIAPIDLKKALDLNPKAEVFFENLAFSYKRDYVAWISDSKKEETRTRRIQKSIELLLDGKKAK